jgi:chaperonin GroEL
VRSALQEGIVSGGGLALYMATNKFNKVSNSENQKVALEILCDAIQVPLEQIIINSGKDPKQIIKLINFDDNNVGYDVKAEVIGDMYKMGVIDPLKVTKNALTNAVSVATIILSTNAIVTHARVKQ